MLHWSRMPNIVRWHYLSLSFYPQQYYVIIIIIINQVPVKLVWPRLSFFNLFLVLFFKYLCSCPYNTFNGSRHVAQLVITQLDGELVKPDHTPTPTTSLTGSRTVNMWINTSAISTSLFCHWSTREAACSTMLLHYLSDSRSHFRS